MEIHKAGGGIHFTVRHTKDSSEETLYNSLIERLKKFSRSGTTFIECKSGYGLEWETEHKLLKVLTKAKRELKSIGLSNTYLGAHAVPLYVLIIQFLKSNYSPLPKSNYSSGVRKRVRYNCLGLTKCKKTSEIPKVCY